MKQIRVSCLEKCLLIIVRPELVHAYKNSIQQVVEAIFRLWAKAINDLKLIKICFDIRRLLYKDNDKKGFGFAVLVCRLSSVATSSANSPPDKNLQTNDKFRS